MQPIFKKQGITLIELLIVMAILAITLAAIFSAYVVGLRMFTGEITRSDVIFEANKGLERLSKELRESRAIFTAQNTTITFWWKDLNSNSTSEASEIVTYSWDGTADGNLMRTNVDPLITAKYIQNFSLAYDNPSDIKLITATLTTGIGEEIVTLESTVRPRNL